MKFLISINLGLRWIYNDAKAPGLAPRGAQGPLGRGKGKKEKKGERGRKKKKREKRKNERDNDREIWRKNVKILVAFC